MLSYYVCVQVLVILTKKIWNCLKHCCILIYMKKSVVRCARDEGTKASFMLQIWSQNKTKQNKKRDNEKAYGHSAVGCGQRLSGAWHSSRLARPPVCILQGIHTSQRSPLELCQRYLASSFRDCSLWPSRWGFRSPDTPLQLWRWTMYKILKHTRTQIHMYLCFIWAKAEVHITNTSTWLLWDLFYASYRNTGYFLNKKSIFPAVLEVNLLKTCRTSCMSASILDDRYICASSSFCHLLLMQQLDKHNVCSSHIHHGHQCSDCMAIRVGKFRLIFVHNELKHAIVSSD